MALIHSVKNCFSKEEFIDRMNSFGWRVNWSDKRKHITFENKEGQKVRDSNLAKTFRLDIGKEQSQKLEVALSTNQELLQQNQKQQEQLERKIEAIQVQNSRLNNLVDLSNVTAVEIAQKERDIVLKKTQKRAENFRSS